MTENEPCLSAELAREVGEPRCVSDGQHSHTYLSGSLARCKVYDQTLYWVGVRPALGSVAWSQATSVSFADGTRLHRATPRVGQSSMSRRRARSRTARGRRCTARRSDSAQSVQRADALLACDPADAHANTRMLPRWCLHGDNHSSSCSSPCGGGGQLTVQAGNSSCAATTLDGATAQHGGCWLTPSHLPGRAVFAWK